MNDKEKKLVDQVEKNNELQKMALHASASDQALLALNTNLAMVEVHKLDSDNVFYKYSRFSIDKFQKYFDPLISSSIKNYAMIYNYNIVVDVDRLPKGAIHFYEENEELLKDMSNYILDQIKKSLNQQPLK